MKRIALAMTMAASALGSASVFAAATYNFSSAGSSTCTAEPTTYSSSCWGNTRSYTATDSANGSSITLTAKAYSNTGGTGASSNANAPLQTAYLGYYSGGGLGVTNRDYMAGTDGNSTTDTDTTEGDAPEHAVDNNQRYDMVLLSFSKSVAISKVSLGYAPYDSDISIWAYMGTGTPVMDGALYGDMLSSSSSLVTSGWVVVGNYADIGTAEKSVNGTGLTSSYWLVGAYNPGGTAASCSKTTATMNDGLDCGDDYMKLLTTTITSSASSSTSSAVPEPGSIALAGLALMGLAASRRYRQRGSQ